MKTFKISNFRLFNSKGTEINFKPVTILTGTNSSGKSSFVKAMLLLKSYLHGVRTDESKNPAAVQLDFSDQSLKLSGFEDALNFSCKKGDSINFTIESSSNLAPLDFDVEYSFVKSPYSNAKGELKSIRLSYDGELLCQVDAKAGRISYTFPDLKGKLMKLFLVYLKGRTFQNGRQKWSGEYDDNGEFVGPGTFVRAESKSGLDISDWRKYALEIFQSTELPGESLRRKQLLGVHRYQLSLDEFDMTEAIRKYEETGILFFFPILEELGQLPKDEAIERLRNAAVACEFDGFMNNCGKDMIDIVISEFVSSDMDSFMDFYRSKEDEAINTFIKKPLKHVGTLNSENYLSHVLGRMFGDFDAINTSDSYNFKKATTFDVLCRFLHMWQTGITPETDPFIYRSRQRIPFENYTEVHSYHILPNLYNQYLAAMIPEILTPGSLENFKYIGNSFMPVQRLYSYDDRSSFVDSIRRYEKYTRLYDQNKPSGKKDRTIVALESFGTIKYKPGTFMNRWLQELGIASRLIIDEENDGLGFKLFLEDSKNGRCTSLADQGHGITQLVSILLQIECEILAVKIKEAQGFDSYKKDRTPNYGDTILAIEEPEVSLHPSMQSKLALLFEDAARNGVHLIVETHSEYMVRRTQAYVAGLKSDKEFEKNPFVVYYFNDDGTSYDLEYMKSGRFAKSFGTGFFDEAGKSSIEILRREREDRI